MFLFLTACNNNDNVQLKFDQVKWNEKEDPAFPPSNRVKMLDDLTTKSKLIGLSYEQIKDFLGVPDFLDGNSFSYTIVEKYGKDIDPIYTKNLKFYFSNDSIITSFKINEWKK